MIGRRHFASGEGKESRFSLLRTHWDHEPRLNGRCRASVLDCGSPLPLLRPRAGCESARGLAQSKISRCEGRFMERMIKMPMPFGTCLLAKNADEHLQELDCAVVEQGALAQRGQRGAVGPMTRTTRRTYSAVVVSMERGLRSMQTQCKVVAKAVSTTPQPGQCAP